jgi:muramoyltetrapeptide carboxypeptidase
MAPSSTALRAAPLPWLRPPPLRRGDRVRLIAPGGAFTPQALDSGLLRLQAAGLVPIGHDLLTAQDGYYAGSDQERAQVLADALADDDARALWAVRGGSGSARLVAHVPALDVSCLRAQPRWLVGFSDITCLHGVWSQAQVISLHGANLCNLPAWGHAAQADLFATLFDHRPKAPLWQGTTLARTQHPTVVGPLVGGNLTVLSSLCGTALLPSWSGCIVVLEDIDEAPYRLDRCMHQLVQAGAFTGALGVVLGQWTRCAMDRAMPMLLATLAPLGLPVLGDMPLGHDTTSWAVALGAQAKLDMGAGTLEVLQ